MSEVIEVIVDRQDRIAWLTLNRPDAANALSKTLVRALWSAIAGLRGEDQPPILVLTGAGEKAFCAGADLKERLGMSLDEARGFLGDLNTTFDQVATYPQPVIAALNGAAFGGGLELALACDIRLAAEGIEIGLPEVRLGIIPGAGGTQRLSRLCGVAAAKELILTGRRISTAHARELDLVSAVVSRANLRDEAARWAAEMAEAGPLALAQAKRAIDEGDERGCYDVVLKSEDRNEGLRAFADKRKPRFTGK